MKPTERFTIVLIYLIIKKTYLSSTASQPANKKQKQPIRFCIQTQIVYTYIKVQHFEPFTVH